MTRGSNNVKLSAIVEQLPNVIAFDGGDPDIGGVCCDSRKVEPGFIFAAIPGAQVDGHSYLEAAAKAGGVACIVADGGAQCHGMARVLVEDVEEALGWASSAFWGHPSRALTLVGITGTNGKTTTAHLVRHLLESSGIVTGMIGTVGYLFPEGVEPASLTTPEAPIFQAALSRMLEEGAGAVVAEISSHALKRKRVEGSAFACTVFTNLTQDHLDFHGSMEEYYQAKRLLFTDHPRLVEAVVNVDDSWGRQLAPDLGGQVVTFGLNDGDVRFEVTSSNESSTAGVLHFPNGQAVLHVPLAGRFNAYNATTAMAVAWALGLDMEKAAQAMKSAPQTPGRIEAVENEAGIGAFVDYAHTPDALDRLLETLKDFTVGKLICVFGCGGDRDRSKRPLMARAAAKWSDVIVVTSDNSRSESTEKIIGDVEEGLPENWSELKDSDSAGGYHTYMKIPDRHEAIRWAVMSAASSDTVVVAGKGHEGTQIIGDEIFPFNDRLELESALKARGDSCA